MAETSPCFSDIETTDSATAIKLPPPRAGDTCPRCIAGRLDYNGLLLLECTQCGYQAITPSACTY